MSKRKRKSQIKLQFRTIVFYLLFIFTIFGLWSSSVNNPVFGQSKGLEIVATLPANNPPGNIAVTPEGRLIMSQHQFFGAPLRVVEVMEDDSTQPFPNLEWSSEPNARGIGLHTVLGLRSDKNGVVWMLDRSPGEGMPGKIIAWDTKNKQLYRVIYLPQPIIADNSFLNDLAVDLDHNAIYITDTAGKFNSALIVVDLNTGLSRRVLEGDRSTLPEDIPMVIDERIIMLGEEEARIGANPITVDPNNEWVYYAPMNGTSLYRLRTADLLNESLSDDELASKVERYGDKPICDGITVDGAGNVYITSITDYAIGVTDATGKYRTLYQDRKLLSWTDGMAFGADNYVYVTVSQLHKSPPLNNGKNEAQEPFYLVRFPALASGNVGR